MTARTTDRARPLPAALSALRAWRELRGERSSVPVVSPRLQATRQVTVHLDLGTAAALSKVWTYRGPLTMVSMSGFQLPAVNHGPNILNGKIRNKQFVSFKLRAFLNSVMTSRATPLSCP